MSGISFLRLVSYFDIILIILQNYAQCSKWKCLGKIAFVCFLNCKFGHISQVCILGFRPFFQNSERKLNFFSEDIPHFCEINKLEGGWGSDDT